MKFISLEGNTQKLDGGAMFGNAPKALWTRWVKTDELNRIDLSCRALLVKDLAGKTCLFEAGVGAFFEPKLASRYGIVESDHVLLKSLEEHGLTHKDIDAVVLSHLHFDHAGGLLSPFDPEKEPELLFPNARYYVSQSHWERALSPHVRDRASFIPVLNKLLKESGRLELVTGDRHDDFGEAIQFHYSDGHTVGLMLAEIRGDADQGGIVFCGDLIPGRPWVHLPITMGYDRFPEQLIEEKKKFLDHAMENNLRLFFTHDSECAAAAVEINEKGKYATVNEVASLI